MFRGLTTINLDSKGRLAVPTRFREILRALESPVLVVTVNPWDRSLWIYPLGEWQEIESKLAQLSDFDRQSRRTKQIMRGYATDVECDTQGRILLSAELREIASLTKQGVLLGQDNKLELWDRARWESVRNEWLDEVASDGGAPSPALESLAL